MTGDTDKLAYARQREQAERAAANVAKTPEAIQAHEQMAELYAELLRQAENPQPQPSDNVYALPRVVILGRD